MHSRLVPSEGECRLRGLYTLLYAAQFPLQRFDLSNSQQGRSLVQQLVGAPAPALLQLVQQHRLLCDRILETQPSRSVSSTQLCASALWLQVAEQKYMARVVSLVVLYFVVLSFRYGIRCLLQRYLLAVHAIGFVGQPVLCAAHQNMFEQGSVVH